jgi:hypothetical protein
MDSYYCAGCIFRNDNNGGDPYCNYLEHIGEACDLDYIDKCKLEKVTYKKIIKLLCKEKTKKVK